MKTNNNKTNRISAMELYLFALTLSCMSHSEFDKYICYPIIKKTKQYNLDTYQNFINTKYNNLKNTICDHTYRSNSDIKKLKR